MKNLKKYILTSLACAGISICVILADETDTKKSDVKISEVQPFTKTESKDVQTTAQTNDQNKQIVPVIPSTEQNQIVKKEEPTQAQNSAFGKLLNCTRSEKIEKIATETKRILNESISSDQIKSNGNNLDCMLITSHWIKDKWIKQENEKFSNKEIDTLKSIIDNTVTYLKNIQQDSSFETIADLICLDDVYKPFFIKKLFPELEAELKDIKLNERAYSFSESKENYNYSFSSYSYTYIPEEECQNFAAYIVEQFRNLTTEKQLVILAAWLTNEWTTFFSK